MTTKASMMINSATDDACLGVACKASKFLSLTAIGCDKDQLDTKLKQRDDINNQLKLT